MTFDFGVALDHLKNSGRLTRHNWNAAGQFVVLQKGYPDGVPANANTAAALGIEQGDVIKFRPYLVLRTADGSLVPWVPSVSDVLAEDWALAES